MHKGRSQEASNYKAPRLWWQYDDDDTSDHFYYIWKHLEISQAGFNVVGPRIRIISRGSAEGAGGSVGSSQAINSFLAAFYNSNPVLSPVLPFSQGFTKISPIVNQITQRKFECVHRLQLFLGLKRAWSKIVGSAAAATIFQRQTSAETWRGGDLAHSLSSW